MHAQLMAIDDTSNGQQVKHLHDGIIDLLITPVGQTLFPKVKYLCHFTRFMISAQHYHFFRVLDLQGCQVAHDFGTHGSSVYVIAKEYIIDQLRWFKFIEHWDHVEELSVNVAENI